MVHRLVPIDSLDVVTFPWDVKFIMSMNMVRWYLFISGPENRLALFSQRLTLSSHCDFHLEWIWSVWNYFPNAMNSWQAILSQSSWQVYNWNSLSRCCIKGRRKSYWTIFPMAKFRQEEVEEVAEVYFWDNVQCPQTAFRETSDFSESKGSSTYLRRYLGLHSFSGTVIPLKYLVLSFYTGQTQTMANFICTATLMKTTISHWQY